MRFSLKLLVAVLQLASSSAQDLTAAELNDLELQWSYGRSEPVYPTPEGAGLGEWADAYAKAKDLVAQLTNDEKNSLTYGVSSSTNGCGGSIPNITRVGFPGLCLQDAGNGVRATDMVNSYPSGLHAGASWNRNLTYSRGHYMGAEFKAKGVNIALGPVAGPIGKLARGGRNWEGFSNDAYLAGALTGETVKGLQESVVACVKHFVGNEQESNRNIPTLIESNNQSLSVNIDDKTMHEVYLWPFQDAIKAGAGSVMCSYNRVNNSYGCQNSKNLNGYLKGELGFQGFVMSDWGAQHTGIASAEAGLDMAMSSSKYWQDGNLTLAVSNGSMSQTRLDDMATRILASWYRYADEIEEPGFGLPSDLLSPHTLVDARDTASRDTIFQGAVEGHVLVKNTDNVLPFKSPKFISLFGYDGVAATHNTLDDDDFMSWYGFGLYNSLQYENGSAANNNALMYQFLSSISEGNIFGPGIALNGTIISGGGSGASTPAYIDAPFDAFQRRAREDGTFLNWDFHSTNPSVNPASEACVVFINAQSAEGWDRPHLRDDYSDALVLNVAAQCNNTMVVLHNAGVRLVDQWVDNPNITAIIFAHLPGQDSGAALVEVMYGVQSPSGRLPYTVAKNESDYGTLLDPTLPSAEDEAPFYPQEDFTEGVYIDYKHFIQANITPRYEFGFGLTYTTFEYTDLAVELTGQDTSTLPPGNGTVSEGGVASLWDVLAVVNITVTNTGDVEAAEVAQLYIGIPGGPEKVLRGFEKQLIAPGASVTIGFDLTRRDLSSWDVVQQSWVLTEGTYGVYVGKSVLDTQLTDTLTI